MELDDSKIEDLENRIYKRVIDELSKKYYLIPKNELEELTDFVKNSAEKISETKRKMSDCGCAGITPPPVNVDNTKSDAPVEKTNDTEDESETTENPENGEPPSLREAWKVDDQIYEFEPPTPGEPSIFSILKYVTINLVWHIDTIYNCHLSLLNIEWWILSQAIPAITFLSVEPVVGQTEIGGMPPHTHDILKAINVPGFSLFFFPMPRFIRPWSPPEGPAHYFIGNEIPES